jgi:hypothetical protein
MRSKVLKVGLDPHFSFANMLCDVAWSRSHGTGIMILPNPKEEGSARGQADRDRAVELKMPGLPSGVVQMIDATSPGSCGRCSAFKDGFCEERGLNVGAADAGCPLFEARPY